MGTTANAAEDFASLAVPLCEKGWNPFPIEPGGKGPPIVTEEAAECLGLHPRTVGRRMRWGGFKRRQLSLFEVTQLRQAYGRGGVAVPFGPVIGVVGFDFDADDPLEAGNLNEMADDILGDSPIRRVGKWPRHTRLYRAQRVRSQNIGKVQVLARGRYSVMFGQHPVTGERYYYDGLSPLDLTPRDLPVVTPKQVELFRRAVLGEEAASTTRKKGWTGGGTGGATGFTLDQAMQGVMKGRRRDAMLCVASAYRGRGRSESDARDAVATAAARCIPQFPLPKAHKLVRWVYIKLPAGTPRIAGHRLDRKALDRIAGGKIPPVFQVALSRALENRYPLDHGTPKYQLLVSIARDLQRFRGDQPIALPQPLLSSLLGCTQQAVSWLISQALEDGLLTLADGTYHVRRRAKTYWFAGDLDA